MNIIENAEKECAVLGSLFQGIVNEMKVRINIKVNIQLLVSRSERIKGNYICLTKDIILKLWRPFNTKVSLIIMHHTNYLTEKEKKNFDFFCLSFLFYRTVHHYGKIFHRKQIKCIFNWSKWTAQFSPINLEKNSIPNTLVHNIFIVFAWSNQEEKHLTRNILVVTDIADFLLCLSTRLDWVSLMTTIDN